MKAIVQYLVEEQHVPLVGPGGSDWTALTAASQWGRTDVIEYLLAQKQYSFFDQSGLIALLAASSKEVIALLLSKYPYYTLDLSSMADLLQEYGLAYDIELLCKTMAENRTIISLNLANNGLMDHDLDHLLAALKVNKRLQRLDLSHNSLTDDGLSNLFNTLQEHNKTVLQVTASHNCLPDEENAPKPATLASLSMIGGLNYHRWWESVATAVQILVAARVLLQPGSDVEEVAHDQGEKTEDKRDVWMPIEMRELVVMHIDGTGLLTPEDMRSIIKLATQRHTIGLSRKEFFARCVRSLVWLEKEDLQRETKELKQIKEKAMQERAERERVERERVINKVHEVKLLRELMFSQFG